MLKRLLIPGRIARAVLAAGLAVGVSLPAVPSAFAASITVTTTHDELNNDGDCSLREAIQAANTDAPVDACPAGTTNDRINLPAGRYDMETTPNGEDANLTGDWDLLANMSITGAGARSTIISATGDRVFDVFPGAVVTLGYLWVEDGTAPTGGNIRNAGNLTLESVIVSNGLAASACLTSPCTAIGGQGGGIYNTGTLSLFKSVVRLSSAIGFAAGSGEQLHIRGGAIFNAGTAGVHQSTIEENGASDRNNVAADTSGAGIYNSGSLEITRSTLNRNNAPECCGGAIRNDGNLVLSNSTLNENFVGAGRGGGLANFGTARLTNVTVVGNSAGLNGSCSGACAGGLSNDGFLSLGNTIVALNNTGGSAPDCGGPQPLVSRGFNLIGNAANCTRTGATNSDLVNTNPNVGPLANNGGPTLTMALLPGSPAIDRGNPAAPGSTGDACPTTDQRAVTRPRDGNSDGLPRCDIGAHER